MAEIDLILLLMAQTATDAAQVGSPSLGGPPVPAWGLITIVLSLAGTITTLAGVTYRALNQVVKAKDETIARAEDTNNKLSGLLERAIEAFSDSKAATVAQTEKHNQYIQEVKELKEEVRRVGEKLSSA